MGVLSRAGLLAGLAAFCVGMTDLVRAEEPLASIAIGDITFNYRPASWRIEREGEGLVATCVQEDCRGAVVDIGRRQGEAGCTIEAMRAGAEQAFPAADRAYANILRVGRFALVLAQRHDGPDLSSPEFAYACLVWQGHEYRFAMRPETIGSQSWIGGALHYLVSLATAPEAPVEELRIGDVTFSLSTEVWTVGHRETSPDGSAETVWLACRMPTCFEPGLRLSVSVRPPDGPCPPELPGYELDYGGVKHGRILKETPDGLDFTTAEFWLGCRNYVPPRVAACTIHKDRSYHISTPGAHGCRGSLWEIPDAALIDFLKSARVAQ